MIHFGTPFAPSAFKVFLLGSGELGKELAIELLRLGVEVTACDSYDNAPAMQIAQKKCVIDMKNSAHLEALILKEKPHLIVPEVEAISTEALTHLEAQGFAVAPCARAVRLTMDREGIRRFASEELGLPTARFSFADNETQFIEVAHQMGFPCVVKPLMSSSGKGQSVVSMPSELSKAWQISQTAGRTGAGRVIVEEFVPFISEITLLTVVSRTGTAFCAPIGHRQEGGDYVESWQPHFMNEKQLQAAKEIAFKITQALGGFGLFGVELFLLSDDRVLFSEVSPRPHDTGMVTQTTQKLNQFALHARAILGLPVSKIERFSAGASAAFRAHTDSSDPVYHGVPEALADESVEIRIFGKPKAYRGRRMGVVLATDQDPIQAREKAMTAVQKLSLS